MTCSRAGLVAGLLALVAATVVITLTLAGRGADDPPAVPGPPSPKEERDLARAAAVRFLDRYVDADGRVVRHDQGGDTVSEGQAYALLLAAATGDAERFARVWRWTEANLRRPDGLLSFLWRDGEVEDPQAASDADLDAARALALAAARFGRPAYRAAAVRLSEAILREETVRLERGEIVLVAGPWARSSPHAVNPSYFSPRAFTALERLTGDRRWANLRTTSYRLVGDLTRDPTRLPPNWAQIAEGNSISATGPPGSSDEAPQYAFDAVRVTLRMGEDCAPEGRRLAAGIRPLLAGQVRDRLVARSNLDGYPLEGGEHPGAVVAAAAAARADGDGVETRALLTRAERLDAENPTYYGSALVALGRVMLTTEMFGGCRR